MITLRHGKLFELITRAILNEPHGLKLLQNIRDYDPALFSHSLKVFQYSILIGSKAGYSISDLSLIGLAALYHDVGKTVIPPELLGKKGKLTEEEFEEVKKHTIYGYNILRKYTSFPDIISICALQHHERNSGIGYPNQLESKKIHSFSKIIAIADVFDAVTTDRVYRTKNFSKSEALNLLKKDNCKHFHKKFVHYLEEILVEYEVHQSKYMIDEWVHKLVG